MKRPRAASLSIGRFSIVPPAVARGLIAGCLILIPPSVRAQTAPPDPAAISQSSNATIGLIAGGSGSTDAQIAADIASVLFDAGKFRVLPMQGGGSIQNIADLIYLKGVDVAIVHTDALNQTMQRNAIPKEGSVQYIAKLFEEEVHVLAAKNITSLDGLNGQPVNAGPSGSGTELTAANLFSALHIQPSLQNDTDALALDRLRRGEIAAMVVVGGTPVPLLQTVPPGTGLHFLTVPLNAQLVDMYLPTKLGYQQYPSLVGMDQAIDTVAVGAVLVTLATPPDSLRAKRVNRFVDNLFDRFGKFGEPGFHPKWSEVNLFAQFPGWTRYPEAQTLLNKQDQSREANLRSAFDAYLNQTGQTITDLNNERQQALFRDFLRWRERHAGP